MSRFAELDHGTNVNSTDAVVSSALFPATGPDSFVEQDHSRSASYFETHSLVQVASTPAESACVCPGETHSISFSVHLSRLASGYSACRNCHHNDALGQFPRVLQTASHERTVGKSLVTADGVRGIYLNDLDRIRAADWGAAFASILWDEQPRIGRVAPKEPAKQHSNVMIQRRSDPDIVQSTGEGPTAGLDASSPMPVHTVSTSARRGPMVVIGFDERPSSPDIIMGVALGLRRMGCQVIDLGQTTSPCFHFAVHHLEAAGGVFVTGSGRDPAWTGFQFSGGGALPCQQPDFLNELQRRANSNVVRPTRTAGSQRPFHAAIPYQAGLWKLFHALRPLQVVVGTSTRQLPRTLNSLFARLPCRLTHEVLPVRRRDLGDPHDVDVRRVASATVAGQQHLGLIVDDDGERCAFVTDRGQLVSIGELARLLVLFELHERRSAKIVIDESLSSQVSGWLNPLGSTCQVEQASTCLLPKTVIQHSAELGITADHRVWFGGAYPACNAILTLARVLQALSLSDSPMSDVLNRLS